MDYLANSLALACCPSQQTSAQLASCLSRPDVLRTELGHADSERFPQERLGLGGPAALHEHRAESGQPFGDPWVAVGQCGAIDGQSLTEALLCFAQPTHPMLKHPQVPQRHRNLEIGFAGVLAVSRERFADQRLGLPVAPRVAEDRPEVPERRPRTHVGRSQVALEASQRRGRLEFEPYFACRRRRPGPPRHQHAGVASGDGVCRGTPLLGPHRGGCQQRQHQGPGGCRQLGHVTS